MNHDEYPDVEERPLRELLHAITRVTTGSEEEELLKRPKIEVVRAIIHARVNLGQSAFIRGMRGLDFVITSTPPTDLVFGMDVAFVAPAPTLEDSLAELRRAGKVQDGLSSSIGSGEARKRFSCLTFLRCEGIEHGLLKPLASHAAEMFLVGRLGAVI